MKTINTDTILKKGPKRTHPFFILFFNSKLNIYITNIYKDRYYFKLVKK